MGTANLKNHGKSLLEMLGSVPAETAAAIAEAASTIMAKHLPAADLARYAEA